MGRYSGSEMARMASESDFLSSLWLPYRIGKLAQMAELRMPTIVLRELYHLWFNRNQSELDRLLAPPKPPSPSR